MLFVSNDRSKRCNEHATGMVRQGVGRCVLVVSLCCFVILTCEQITNPKEVFSRSLFKSGFIYVKASKGLSTSTGSDMEGKKNPLKLEPNAAIVKREGSPEQVDDTKILGTLFKYLWVKDNLETCLRVFAALDFLIGAKVLNVQVPFLFKLAVDWLSTATSNDSTLASFTTSNSTVLALFVSQATVLIRYGIARARVTAFNELQTAVFSKVSLRTIRLVSRKVFSHLHEIDLNYHLRGTRADYPENRSSVWFTRLNNLLTRTKR